MAAVGGCALAVTRISLTNFRSYARTELRVAGWPVVLAGANGTGKTNLYRLHVVVQRKS